MSFDEEWGQLSARAAQRGSPHMRLNHVPDEPGGGAPSGDLVVHQDDLGAVGTEAYQLHGRLRKKADIAGAGMNGSGAGSTMQAAKELTAHNFATGAALSTTVSMWTSQAGTVLQMCADISNHLDYSRKLHARDEARIEAGMRHRDGSPMSPSEISKLVT